MSKRVSFVLAITIAALTTFGCSSNQIKSGVATETRNTAEVIQVFDELVDAAKSLDTERYLSMLDSSEFTSLNADGTVYRSYQRFADSFREQNSYIKRYISLDFTDIKVVEIDSNTSILLNEYVAKVELRSGRILEAAGAGTQVWSKQSGKWRLVHVSSSAAAP